MAGHLHKESWKIRCKLHSVYFNGFHYSANVNVHKGVVGRKVMGRRIHPSPFPLPRFPFPLPSPSPFPFPPSSAPVIKLFTSIKSQDWKFRSRKHANSITWLAQISFSFGCSTCSSHSCSVKINQMVHKVDQRYMQRHLINLPKNS